MSRGVFVFVVFLLTMFFLPCFVVLIVVLFSVDVLPDVVPDFLPDFAREILFDVLLMDKTCLPNKNPASPSIIL